MTDSELLDRFSRAFWRVVEATPARARAVVVAALESIAGQLEALADVLEGVRS